MSKTELRTVLSPDAASAARFASSSKPQRISKSDFEKWRPVDTSAIFLTDGQRGAE
jgi:hypothetical protein